MLVAQIKRGGLDMEEPYSFQTEEEHSFLGDVFLYMEQHGVSKEEAIHIVSGYECYQSLFINGVGNR